VTPSRPRWRGATHTVSSKTILVIAALVALALSASGCGRKSEADVTRCIEKKGLPVRHTRIRFQHLSGKFTLPHLPHFKMIVAPALVVQTQTNRVTIVFVKSQDQLFEAALALSGGLSEHFGREYAGNIAGVWESRPRKDEARLVEGCLPRRL
jgi:hypothetical protein